MRVTRNRYLTKKCNKGLNKKRKKRNKDKRKNTKNKIKTFIDILNISYLKYGMENLKSPHNLFIINNSFKAQKIYKHCERARKQGLINIEYYTNSKVGYGITNKGIKVIEEHKKKQRNERNIYISLNQINIPKNEKSDHVKPINAKNDISYYQ